MPNKLLPACRRQRKQLRAMNAGCAAIILHVLHDGGDQRLGQAITGRCLRNMSPCE